MGGYVKMDSKDAYTSLNAGIGLAIGAGFGLAIGTITGNIAVWMPICAVLGLIFGAGLTRQDKRRKDVAK
jgi:uncharacterized membrane protein YoaK (UPF0700 family)